MSNESNGKLYRHFDKNDRLLYVGISFTLLDRTKSHRHCSHWFNEVTKITVQTFKDKKSLLEAERLAILKEKPLYNVHFSLPKDVSYKKTLTITEIAFLLKITTRTLYRMIDDERFNVKPIPGTKPFRWNADAVKAWVNK